MCPAPLHVQVVLYLHGGGYCFGSFTSYRVFLAYLSRFARAPVLAVDYRLAPEVDVVLAPLKQPISPFCVVWEEPPLSRIFLIAKAHCTCLLCPFSFAAARFFKSAVLRFVFYFLITLPCFPSTINQVPFPGGLHDAVSAFQYLTEAGGGSGGSPIDNPKFDPAQVVLAGDSAGGGLSLALALFLWKEKGVRPGGVACLSPWVDLNCISDSWWEDSSSVGKDYLPSQKVCICCVCKVV